MDIGAGNFVTSSITLAAANELGLRNGSEVSVLIKAGEVIFGVDN